MAPAAAAPAAATPGAMPTRWSTISGTVLGLKGTGLVLQDNGGDNLSVVANGAFTFATPVASGGPYAVSVLTQPSDPLQTCAVTMGDNLRGCPRTRLHLPDPDASGGTYGVARSSKLTPRWPCAPRRPRTEAAR